SEAAVPEETRFRPGPETGVTVQGGVTHATLSFGPRSTQIVIDGNKAAVTNRDGRWESVSLSDQGYGSEGFAASLARRIDTPAAEAKELASALTSLTADGDVVVGTLPVDEASDRLDTRRRGESVQDAKGTVCFWITDGLLTKYVLRVEGKIVDDGQRRESWRQTTVEIKDIGTAKLELPRGATEALKRPLPNCAPRLSAAQEAALFELRGKRDVDVHDPSSIVKCGDEYWFFSTGTGVSSWRSKDLQTWQRGPRVFPEIPNWVTDVVPGQRGHFWAPDVLQIGDRYLLYYSVSSFGKNTSAIALASTPTLNPDDSEFGWTDHGVVIQSCSDDDFNAIDPAVIRTAAGELWMSFGSFWSGLKLIQLDPQTGKRNAEDKPDRSIANYRQIEAPHIYQHDGWLYLFVNWGKCCSGVDSTYNIRVGRSRTITGPYLDKDGVDLAEGGGTLLLESEGPFIGPGHTNVLLDGDRYLLSCHFYDGTERGRSKLSIQEMSWSKEGWPVVASAPNAQVANGQLVSIDADQVPTKWIDPRTGHRVVRLSKQAGSASLYFHQNTYTPEGDKLLISTPRGLETVDLETRKLKVVVPRQSYRMGGSSGVEMGRKSRHVYYSTRSREGTVVRATHIDTGKTREIVTLPRGSSFNGVNADETLLFGSMQEFRRDRERLRKLFTVEIDSGKLETFHPSRDWLNHLQCSPTDPNFGVFCHEGSWHELDRVWTIRFGSNQPKLMHKRQQQYEIAGHEFFSADGQWVWYDLQTPRADQFWLAGVHVKTGERIGYRLAREEWSVHYNISRDGKLFAGDGGGPQSVANQTPLPEKRRLNPPGNGQWIYLFRPGNELTDGTLSGEPAKLGTFTAERLVDLSTHDYDLEPNVTFTPDGKWIVFRSNMHGERHVYMVSVKREAKPNDVDPTTSKPETESDSDKRRLVLIGDSTVKNGRGRGDDGMFGWGQLIDKHFDSEKLEVENRALGGRSSRTYLTEGLWQKSLDRLREGDFVMMQFGHNDGGKMFEGDRPRASIKGNSDESIDGVVEATGKAETVHSFGWYLRKYVADAKAKGAIPIVLSQVPRDRWQDGRVIRSDKDYGLWAREAAKQSGALFIDLNEIVARRYEELGETKVGRDLFTPEDWTHTKREGAEINAACVAEGVNSLKDCDLKDCLRKETDTN
ncbi:MAG: oligogalacturonate lyase family protein, partial [Rubripirellula sp.]